jgi:internalin A
MHRLLYLPALAVLLAPTASAADTADEKAAVEAIEKLGGKVVRDDKAEGQPVAEVNLSNNHKVKGDDLKHLRAFKQLRKLDLGFTAVGDEGLKQLHDLSPCAS